MSSQVERGTVREMVHTIAFRARVLERILQEPVYGGLEVRTDELAHVQLLQRQIDDLRRYLSLPSAEPERKWIPVSKKLPKVRTDVLLAFEKNMAVGFYSHDCWNVNTGNGFYTGVFTDEDKPIAWMPLPEPWRGE